MTNDQHLDALDRRGQAAATALQSQAARRPRPAFDPDRPLTLTPPAPAPARNLRRPALAVAAALVVLAGIAGALALRSDDAAEDQTAVTSDGPRPFAATDLPGGLRLSRVFEAMADGSDTGPVPLDLYGPAVDQPGLGIGALPTPPDWPAGPDRIDLGNGRFAELRELSLPGTVLSLVVDGTTVLVLGPTEDRDLLEDVARRLEVVDGRPAVDPAVFPTGWSKLGTVPDVVGAASPLSSTTLAGGGAEFLTLYARGEALDERLVMVGSSAGDEARLHALRLVTSDVRTVVVRGKQGLLGTVANDDGPVLRTLAWLERPGELLRVSGSDVSQADLVRVAEGLEPIEDDAWSELLRRSELGDLRDPDGLPATVPVGEGRFADGTSWVLQPTLATTRDEAEEPQVELVVDLPSDDDGTTSSGSSTDLDEATTTGSGFRGMSTQQEAGRSFLYGVLEEDVTAVLVRSPDGTDLGRATVVEGEGIRAWVYEQTDAEVVVVAVDGDGSELERIGVRDHGREILTEGSGVTETTAPPPGPGD